MNAMLTKFSILLLLFAKIYCHVVRRIYDSPGNKWKISDSPVYVKQDVIIEQNGELTIDPGVIVKVDPSVGIYVKGKLIAKGIPSKRILFTTSHENPQPLPQPLVRLVDGPNILTGRLQIFHKNKWRSVCTNSKKWTGPDYQVACRQMGFQGGIFFDWFDKINDSRRLLFEFPNCRGTERSFLDCNWKSYQMGDGPCGKHADIGLQCLPHFDDSVSRNLRHWKGIEFIHAKHNMQSLQETRRPVSMSSLNFVDITYAGLGRNSKAVASLSVIGVAPEIRNLTIENSAYDGINIVSSRSDVFINDCTISDNRGYGIFINTTEAAFLNKCSIERNSAEAVKFIFHNSPLENVMDDKPLHDLCRDALLSTQSFPLYIIAQQFPSKNFRNDYQNFEKDFVQVCGQYFRTKIGYILTVHVVHMLAEEDGIASLVIRDGINERSPVIMEHKIRNFSYPQAVSSTQNVVHISFVSLKKKSIIVHIKVISGKEKSPDLVVSNCRIGFNNGTGVLIENVRSAILISNSSVSSNGHFGGVSIVGTYSDVNISGSELKNNENFGIKILQIGGIVNISHSKIHDNLKDGILFVFNKTFENEPIKKEIVIEYSDIRMNKMNGILIGNFCSPLLEKRINISGNIFQSNKQSALKILSCLLEEIFPTELQIGHNIFRNNQFAIDFSPAVNLRGVIEHNYFTEQRAGTILIQNDNQDRSLDFLFVDIEISNNKMVQNYGLFVFLLELSQYGLSQHLLVTRNFIQNNEIVEPFRQLNFRNRVGAVLSIGSSNVEIFRNIIANKASLYEIASRGNDQSKTINATYNWLGSKDPSVIFYRIFDRKDRYNLQKINYNPYLLLYNDPETDFVSRGEEYISLFYNRQKSEIGGELTGQEILGDTDEPLVLSVRRDIFIAPGGILKIPFGMTLKFDRGIGIMVAGRLHAEGTDHIPNHRVTFIMLDQDRHNLTSNNVMLVGGKGNHEGRLKVKLGSKWGTVCNYGWTFQDSSLVCHQLGFVYNPEDSQPSNLNSLHMDEKLEIILSNVKCTQFDFDITNCLAEQEEDIDNSCTHEDDVFIKCQNLGWAGIRFGITAETSILKYALIDKAGLFDAGSSQFMPAITIDFNRHVIQDIVVTDSNQDGLGILYSDFYNMEKDTKHISSSRFKDNKRHGISLRTLDLKLTNSDLTDNQGSGLFYNPLITFAEKRELLGWMRLPKVQSYNLYKVSSISEIRKNSNIFLYLNPWRLNNIQQEKIVRFRTDDNYVIGIQIFSIDHDADHGSVLIYDGFETDASAKFWNIANDVMNFPCLTKSSIISIKYITSANFPLQEVAFILSSIPRRQPSSVLSTCYPEPSLYFDNIDLKRNRRGFHIISYNSPTNSNGDAYLQHTNQSIIAGGLTQFIMNKREAILVSSHSGNGNIDNLSETKLILNGSKIIGNGIGIRHFNRIYQYSQTIFHWVMNNITIEKNERGGIFLRLPYVVNYNENLTHTILFANNKVIENKNFEFVLDGHFSRILLINNIFEKNECHDGFLSIRGMEKQMLTSGNIFQENQCRYIIEFDITSQSKIRGAVHSEIRRNNIRNNKCQPASLHHQSQLNYLMRSFTVAIRGLQTVVMHDNLLEHNDMEYDFISGIPIEKLGTVLNIQYNWWGARDYDVIKKRIFDFDTWNCYAIANFTPYYVENYFDAPLSHPYPSMSIVDANNLGGRIYNSLHLNKKNLPYIIRSDITIMPSATVKVDAGVELQFFPSVGILVLGTLYAVGSLENKIRMVPFTKHNKRSTLKKNIAASSRLCIDGICSGDNQGFLEIYNHSTSQWVPICDKRFSRVNALVVCRELGYDTINVFYDFGRRYEYSYNSLDRIISWPRSYLCQGREQAYQNCSLRLSHAENETIYQKCHYNDTNFTFVHCAENNLPANKEYWGGIRFSPRRFEEIRSYDDNFITLDKFKDEDSVLKYVEIYGAGILHNEVFPAVQSVLRNPIVEHVTIRNCAGHGISIISAQKSFSLTHNKIVNNLGFGIHILTITGTNNVESRMLLSLLGNVHITRNLFGIVNMCGLEKTLKIEERILLNYRYWNFPMTCIKIFYNDYENRFGFRLLQSNLWMASALTDYIEIYDGNIYNSTAPLLARIDLGNANSLKLFRTQSTMLSVIFQGTGASEEYGFLAEITTLPAASISPGRDIRHNISFSLIEKNEKGGIWYGNSGAFNPSIMLEWNQIRENGRHLFGNFTTSGASVQLMLQNTPNFFFYNNFVNANEGGLLVRADSYSEATSLNGVIRGCIFSESKYFETLRVEGSPISPFQKINVVHNFFSGSFSPFSATILLNKMVANFSFNYITGNKGRYIMVVHGYDAVKLPIYQTVFHNGFYRNIAVNPDVRATIMVNSTGQRYFQNHFVNPDNSIELMTSNSTKSDSWKVPIEARHNWWGHNTTLAVMGRIRDSLDGDGYLKVNFEPFLYTNHSNTDGKCPPNWRLFGDTCYLYFGGPMTFLQAKEFCRKQNASMPYLQRKDYYYVTKYLERIQVNFLDEQMVWVQHYDSIGSCTVLVRSGVDVVNCDYLLPFLCETDPNVQLNPIYWVSDNITIAALSITTVSFLLLLIIIGVWLLKSKHRHQEKLERRNSIRDSIRSSRSTILSGSSYGLHYARRFNPPSHNLYPYDVHTVKQRNGSSKLSEKNLTGDEMTYERVDSQNTNFSTTFSSLDDRFVYDPPLENATVNAMMHPSFNITFRNEGYRDTSLSNSENYLHPPVLNDSSTAAYLTDSTTLNESLFPSVCDTNSTLEQTLCNREDEVLHSVDATDTLSSMTTNSTNKLLETAM